MEEIVHILKKEENFNLNQYKPSTVQRRIARRMSLTNTDRYSEYLVTLRNDPQERKFLTKDFLINVTDFFRDHEAFSIMREKVIPDILARVEANEDIRVWVAGCASGEEAYSLAILLVEAVSAQGMSNEIKIFATDINEHAIKIARKGSYPDSIASEVPPAYLDKYFVKSNHDHHFRLKNQVRNLISFAVQNVATDPPFNRMHLISCRNLLIYLNREVQQRVLASFFFALQDDFYLFLGSSESLGKKAELFRTTSKKWRIYQKIRGLPQNKITREHLYAENPKYGILNQKYPQPRASLQRDKKPSRAELIRQSILRTVVPPTVVVDEEGQILYSHGDLQAFLTWPEGEPNHRISQVVNPAIRSRLRSALYKTRKDQKSVVFHCMLQAEKGKRHKQGAQLQVIPITEQQFTDGQAFSIVFTLEEKQQQDESTVSREDEATAHEDLERELLETREELQNTIEQLDSSTEELKASHEEALSTNEELQSSNEELEASSEELRSLNEELSTVNAQLKDKIPSNCFKYRPMICKES